MRRPHALSLAIAAGLVFRAVFCTPARLTAEPAPQGTLLAVPFLPQTEALCGGAAAAMVLRYWGDRHADVQQFAPLVDRRAGGIADTALVRALEARGWRTERVAGTIDAVRARLARGQPLILLIEDRPSRYHFVVAVGADADHVIVHDPTWGPVRRYPVNAFLERWKPTGYWGLAVQRGDARTPIMASVPDAGRSRRRRDSPAESPAQADRDSHRTVPPETAPSSAGTLPACQRAMDEAVETVEARGLDAAEEVLNAAKSQCPGSSRPASELAGVRFAQRRFGEASALAEQAVAIDRTDEYAWNVLASSRFVQGDLARAVRAWNALDRPTLDSVAIEGLTRTRYSAFARMLPLEPNTLLTAEDFALATRRVRELPGVVSSRVSLTPDADGWATIGVAVVERRVRPRGMAGWTLAAANTLAGRELRAEAPGWNAEGEVWSGSWRWWPRRPRVSVALAMPNVGPAGGVWRVDGSWMAQRYRSAGLSSHAAPIGGSSAAASEPVREERVYGGVSRSNWATSTLRYEVGARLGVWDHDRRAAGVGIEVDRRFAADRVRIAGGVRSWWAILDSAGAGRRDFRTAIAQTTLRLGEGDRPWSGHVTSGLALASAQAPFSEWPDAGDADARSPLLRAHPLARRGIIDSPAFGRRLAFTSIEGRGWVRRPGLLRFGVAAFVDAARAWRRAAADSRLGPDQNTGADRANVSRGALLVDAGIGLRIRWPGRDAVLRIDYGRGLRDGANAVSIGWGLGDGGAVGRD